MKLSTAGAESRANRPKSLIVNAGQCSSPRYFYYLYFKAYFIPNFNVAVKSQRFILTKMQKRVPTPALADTRPSRHSSPLLLLFARVQLHLPEENDHTATTGTRGRRTQMHSMSAHRRWLLKPKVSNYRKTRKDTKIITCSKQAQTKLKRNNEKKKSPNHECIKGSTKGRLPRP